MVRKKNNPNNINLQLKDINNFKSLISKKKTDLHKHTLIKFTYKIRISFIIFILNKLKNENSLQANFMVNLLDTNFLFLYCDGA